MKSDKVLIILRGLPGSGKTSVAEYLANDYPGIICCVDDYHIIDGVYNWKFEIKLI
jgi:uridine kinase